MGFCSQAASNLAIAFLAFFCGSWQQTVIPVPTSQPIDEVVWYSLGAVTATGWTLVLVLSLCVCRNHLQPLQGAVVEASDGLALETASPADSWETAELVSSPEAEHRSRPAVVEEEVVVVRRSRRATRRDGGR